MKFLDRIHEGYVFGRRVRKLAEHFAKVIPPNARVLDIGCGDGLIDLRLGQLRPDLMLRGIDVLIRPRTHIPVDPFDGQTIPHDDGSFDVVLFVDVLHHTLDPMVLLREADRVASAAVVIKDHTANGLLARPTLRFMDYVGNARHGVVLPYNYWTKQRWDEAFRELGWSVAAWTKRLGLYPWPASWVFGRSLHFVARLEPVRSTVHAGDYRSSPRQFAAWTRQNAEPHAAGLLLPKS
jgi:SAM-dependent methyltransferase